MPRLNPRITISDVAKILRCSPSTVRSLIQTGHLPAVLVGKNLVRIHSQALDTFLNPPPLEDTAGDPS